MIVTKKSVAGGSKLIASLIACAMPCAMAFGFNIVGGTGCQTSFDGDAAILTVTQSGTINVTGSGTIDVLLVGGGGGSGALFDNTTDLFGSGGGGGGGVVYQTGIAVTEGDYAITVGAGGAGGGGSNSAGVDGLGGGGSGGYGGGSGCVIIRYRYENQTGTCLTIR